MKVEALAIPEVKLITPPRFNDPRGFFSETWNAGRFADAGVPGPFVQDNHAVSTARGVLRGLHCQVGANAQGKLVRCVKGAIFDVAIDVRRGSPNFGKWVGAEISAENWTQIWVPVGFLHAYCTLTAETEVIYKVTAPYDKPAERGVIWNDPDIGIAWPIAEEEVILSDKDKVLPRLRDCPPLFHV
ncbi:MAG TPA: dTDP-4-dehydrorhamnose 3,5-epimerase [Rhodopila sp.]|uniref:dTDP-4-dehydrorhamnose 3,5-epimerase n=1 Tax=Rhodopila sp. TaxID=2480087 RepID=UPI002BFF661F|nr:dTDP-4-dehydrorhamnose 3,5-epimerase [Rhodopila sp.]HVY17045.1 dTDP-4-dehydrorhamnose 3,5-epimerase [Rhodopila sp.]